MKLDHERRLQGLQEVQETNAARAELIELNVDVVDKAIQVLPAPLTCNLLSSLRCLHACTFTVPRSLAH